MYSKQPYTGYAVAWIAQANTLSLAHVTPGRLQISKTDSRVARRASPITKIQHFLCGRRRSILEGFDPRRRGC
ncbi:hypothetical protein PpBr36_01053 [Pyricularia pennisetigena]|uniref:hypothetical protein n=1 Tax=Pyricularia pennisetigena TaxID=1578925 RepID=UPI00115471E3|nr:hypothetical protein PpBr36_01053 [Pyricularia pennisetigena]TLS29780.1 hypothetical protein PpBr36_01053 [Pyricularia pennisetigena]